jgi:hypothetical protein
MIPKKDASHKVDARRRFTLKMRLQLRIFIFIRLAAQRLPPRLASTIYAPRF